MPLAAATFGKRKLEVSFSKTTVLEDKKLLMEFGPGSRRDALRGVMPRVKKLVGEAKRRLREHPDLADQYIPIIEYIAHRLPRVYVDLAEMMIDSGSTDQQKEMARAYFGLFLETAPPEERPDVWLKMADLCVSEGDLRGEIHALCEAGIGARAAKLISYCAGTDQQGAAHVEGAKRTVD